MFHRKTDYKFKLAIDRLNLLQNVPLLKPHDANDLTKYRLTYTSNMCRKLNISDDDIDGLNVIHITGTKGKGSTCAFIESILRQSGLRTGLFSSPHLIEVRERMKINGASLSYRKFQEYLDYCYDVLVEKWSESDEFEKPSYFQLLTCMMYYAFVKEKVDVAIVEVGIGGQYDCTNIVRNPIACGISSLGLDHCAILGNTIEEIAWQKAGIIKPSCVAFTVNQEPKSALDVIIKRSAEANAPLCLAPPVNKYLDKNLNEMNLGLNGKIQYLNSSLALQIANYWLERRNTKNFDKLEWVKQNQLQLSLDSIPILKPITDLSEAYINGLTKCKWPGRNQIIKSKDESITYYIDGAHTVESIDQFIAWFLDIKRREKPASNDEKNVLLFNYTGERDSSKFLTILLNVDYDMVAFSKLEPYPAANSSPVCDNVRKMPSAALDTDSKYQHLLESFSKLYEEKFAESRKGEKPQCRIFDNILESLNWLTQGRDELLAEQLKNDNTNNMTSKPKINVLITGSLYLVGLSLKVLKFPIG